MIATNVTTGALMDAAKQAHVVLNEARALNSKHTRYQFTLRPDRNVPKIDGHYQWQRTSASWSNPDRKVFAVCWHGHKAFLEALFELCPTAIVRSNIGRHKVIHRGSVDESTADIQIGAPIMGGYPTVSQACLCYDN